MKNKAKLAFELLEQEMEVVYKEDLIQFVGGSGGFNSDCVIEAIAFATGKSYNEVLDAYGSFMLSATGTGSSGNWEMDAVVNGVSLDAASLFAQHMGLTHEGDTPQGSGGMSYIGDQSVAFLKIGSSGHAVVLTSNASSTEYYYYDPQNQTTGTISKDDPSLVQTYGY